jgi:hypothetical protein
MLAKMAMMAITTSNSIRVKPPHRTAHDPNGLESLFFIVFCFILTFNFRAAEYFFRHNVCFEQMTTKPISIALAVVLLGAMSLYLNKDWFASDSIQISHRSLTPRDGLERRGAAVPLANPVVFLANRHLKLTSVRVVPVSELATNKYAHPVWELNSQSNSVPVDEFVYGHRIPGMKPSVKGGTADPLQPGVAYRLLIETGESKSQHDFVAVPHLP